MNAQIVAYILNGLFIAGVIAGVVLHRIDVTTALALITALMTPSAAHVAMNARAAAKDAPPPSTKKDGAP